MVLPRQVFRFLALSLALLGGFAPWAAHSQVQVAPAGSSAPTVNDFRAWQVIHVESGRTVSFEHLMKHLAYTDVIYVGEEHRNRFHIDAAIRILRDLLTQRRSPVLTIEMFSWDGQEGIDRYLSDEAFSRAQFLRDARWKENWGGEFEDYEPLMQFARNHHLPVRAMNPPRPLVRKVAQKGLRQAMTDPDMEKWGMQQEGMVDEPGYRERITGQLRACHGGMSDNTYERIYEASVFRDEGMAKTIVSQLEALGTGEGPIVSYTGAGHIQYRLPVPNRVSRRSGTTVRQSTVYLASFVPTHPEYVQELLSEKIADYLWLTPMSEHGPPRRCG